MPSAPSLHIADLVEQDEARRNAEYERAWKAYDGEGPQPLEVGPDDADDNIRIDFPALIVDKGVSFLVGADGGVALQVKPLADLEVEDGDDPERAIEQRVEEAQAALDAAWTPERRQLDLHNLATNGGVCGHFWLRLYEGGRVSVLDPGNCTAEWLDDDHTIVKRYLIEWLTVDEDGMGVVRRWRIEPGIDPDNSEEPVDPESPDAWTIYLEERDDEAAGWTVIDTTPWQHDYAPIIAGQNLPSPNTFYGTADLKPAVLDMVEQLESIASDMRRIVRMHGHPVPVVIGEDMSRLSTIDVAIGKLLAIPSKDAKLAQLQVAELTSSLELFRELKTALLEATHIPKIALGETSNAGPTAGVALKVEYAPLVERTETKRLTYGLGISEIARRLLDLLGFVGWTVTLSWPDAMPSDPKADAEADEAELRMQIVSKQTIAEKRGHSWEVEQQRIAEERKVSAEALERAWNEGEVEDDE